MLVNTQTRYAVMSLVYLISRGDACPVSLKEVSRSQNLDLGYLEQIFNRLRKAGVVSSVRGPGGGYKVSKMPSEVKLREVMEVFQEDLKLTACSNPNASSCKLHGLHCNSHDLWVYLGEKIGSIFDEITILDIYEGKYANK